MAKYEVEIPHSLPLDEVRRRLKSASPNIEDKYSAQLSWQGEDQLTVSRKGLQALVHLEPTRLRIDLELGLLLSALSGNIREGITRQLSELLAAPAAPAGGPT
jgi:putative polyhydroxyalkanoate system protein